MTKTIVDIYYDQDVASIYVENTLYVEDGKQYMKSTLVELDPEELNDNYYHILNMTANHARFNERPVKIYNEFSSTIVEHTGEEHFDWYGDHRSLEDYDDKVYNKYHQTMIKEQDAFEKRIDQLFGDDADLFIYDYNDGTMIA